MNNKNNIFFNKCLNIFRFVCIIYTVCFLPSALSDNKHSHIFSLKKNILHTSRILNFKNDNEKTSYALGVSLGSYMENSLIQQEKLGFFLNKIQFIEGIKDTILGVLKLSNKEITDRLKHLEMKLKEAEKIILKRNAEENNMKSTAYISEFIKHPGVKKTKTGLLFLVEKSGDSITPKDNDMILVNYKGMLIDGTEFDNSYVSGAPVWLSLNKLILGWQEGIKYIKKGGLIQLVIPPKLAYGADGAPGIPANSTLIFDIELIDIKSL